MVRRAVGILGTGVFLPPVVRTNDWWPSATVEGWRQHDAAGLDRAAEDDANLSEGQRLIDRAMAEYRHDPFRGARERRVMPDDMLSSDMELAASTEALARAGVRPDQLGLILGATFQPDHLFVPQPVRLHERLGAPRACLTMQTETACNALATQLSLAVDRIAAGRADYALLTQASGWARYFRKETPPSAWVGDACTAVVVGPVEDGYGVLGEHHETDGRYFDGLVFGVPGKRWFEEGRTDGYLYDKRVARGVVTETVEAGSAVVRRAIEAAGLRPADIDFYACHQGFAWLRRVTQQLAGLEHARSLDTYAWAGNLAAANVPLVLAMAEREGLLRTGDVVATMAGGSGVTLSSMVLRWGRSR